MYAPGMRRIQIYLEEELDEALKVESAGSGRSKAELIRECVAVRYQPLRPVSEDPLDALVGKFDVEPGDVDDVVYGR